MFYSKVFEQKYENVHRIILENKYTELIIVFCFHHRHS